MFRIVIFAWIVVFASYPATARLNQQESNGRSESEIEENLRSDLVGLLRLQEAIRARSMGWFPVGVLVTPAVGAGHPGLCRRDLVHLTYDYFDSDGAGILPPVLRPMGVRSLTQYFFTAAPSVSSLEGRERPTVPGSGGYSLWDEDCTAADEAHDEGWISAFSGRGAILGYLALVEAADAVQSGDVTIEPCSYDIQSTCNAILAELVSDFRSIRTVSDCGRTGDSRCLSVGSETFFTIEFRQGIEHGENGSVPTINIVSVGMLTPPVS